MTLQTNRIVRQPALLEMVGVSAPTIYRWEKAGKFPQRVKLGPNSVGWRESEVLRWQQDPAAYSPSA